MTLRYLIAGAVLGLAGGLTPGPTMALLITLTLRYNVREGFKVALAPAITDAPIAIAAVLVLRQLAHAGAALGVITLAGAGFLVYLAYETFTARPPDPAAAVSAARSLRDGVIVNALNPHPYLFWLTIGAPTLLAALQAGTAAALAFVVGIYACLIGAKVVIALLVARGKSFLTSRAYVAVIRLLAVALLVFAAMFVRDGLRYFDVGWG